MKLSKYLQLHAISKAEFGRRVGKSRVTVFRWCELSRVPDITGLIKVKEATGGAVGNFEDWVKGTEECQMQ